MSAPNEQTVSELVAKAGVLAEALPFMRRYSGETFVIKYGGNAMGDMSLTTSFARDVVLMKQVGIRPIVVHGGGPQIGAMLERLKIESEFVDGLRVTGAATVEVAEMVLSGSINKSVVSDINAAGGIAVGLSGKDGNMIRAQKLQHRPRKSDSNIEAVLDLGFVGTPDVIDTTLLDTLRGSEIIPVIAPIGFGDDGQTFNINADTVAGAIAGAVKAARLLLLTDVTGVLDRGGQLIADVDGAQARNLIGDGTIHGGMIPKVETCLHALDEGVEAAVILDGRTKHALLLETFTDQGAGTAIWRTLPSPS